VNYLNVEPPARMQCMTMTMGEMQS